MSDKEENNDIEQPTPNNSSESDHYDKTVLSIKDFEKEKPKEEKKQSPKKVDRRSITSKLNAKKARLAKQKKKEAQLQQMKELFGEGSDSDGYESDSDSDSDENPMLKSQQYFFKKQQSKTDRQIQELKDMIFKLAKSQKKLRKRRKSPPIQQQPVQPIIIQQPRQEERKKETSSNPLMQRLLENRVLRR